MLPLIWKEITDFDLDKFLHNGGLPAVYLSDYPGVTHMLAGTRILDRNSNLYGKSFEQFIGMEIRAYLSYTRKKCELAY